MACKKIHIKGRVQNVGFRYSAKKKADAVGAKGHVSNEFDGSVTLLVSGTDRETRLMEKWVRDDETPGHIDSFTVEEYPDEEHTEFKIIY